MVICVFLFVLNEGSVGVCIYFYNSNADCFVYLYTYFQKCLKGLNNLGVGRWRTWSVPF